MLIGRRKHRRPLIIDPIHREQSRPSPGHERFSAHPVSGSRFFGGEQTPLCEPAAKIFQLLIAPQGQHACGRKGFPFVGAPPPLVELLGHLGICVVVEQLVDERNQLWRAATPAAHWDRDGLLNSPFEADVNSDHLLLLEHGHIFQQQAHHAFAVPIRGTCILPHPRKIFHQIGNRLLFKGREFALFRLILLLGFLLHTGQFP